MFIVHIMKKMRAFVMRQDQVNMKLKLARVEKNLTQQDLADMVDVTRQTIGLIEKGKYNPSLNLCISIAKVLNKSFPIQ